MISRAPQSRAEKSENPIAKMVSWPLDLQHQTVKRDITKEACVLRDIHRYGTASTLSICKKTRSQGSID